MVSLGRIFYHFHVTAQAAPLPPNREGAECFSPQDWGAGGRCGRYRDHSHCLAEQLRKMRDWKPLNTEAQELEERIAEDVGK